MLRGFVYFLTNPSMPGLVKIGHTTQDVETRLRQLNSTGVPNPFLLAACVSVVDPARTEAELHVLLAAHRHSNDREFFEGSPSELLREAIPLLIEAIDAPAPPSYLPKRKHYYDLERESVDILIWLTGEQRQYGYNESDLSSWSPEPALKTEARLAHLKELKLVSEKRSRDDWRGSSWRITSEGKKFLFDYGHITDEMLRGQT